MKKITLLSTLIIVFSSFCSANLDDEIRKTQQKIRNDIAVIKDQRRGLVDSLRVAQNIQETTNIPKKQTVCLVGAYASTYLPRSPFAMRTTGIGMFSFGAAFYTFMGQFGPWVLRNQLIELDERLTKAENQLRDSEKLVDPSKKMN